MSASTPQFIGQTKAAHREDAAAGSDSSAKAGRSLWFWVGALFVFGALLWVAMFTASRHIDTREVPLATKGARP